MLSLVNPINLIILGIYRFLILNGETMVEAAGIEIPKPVFVTV